MRIRIDKPHNATKVKGRQNQQTSLNLSTSTVLSKYLITLRLNFGSYVNFFFFFGGGVQQIEELRIIVGFAFFTSPKALFCRTIGFVHCCLRGFVAVLKLYSEKNNKNITIE